MTLYFAPPGEPLDGDNWTELGMLDSDGYQLEPAEETENVETWEGETLRQIKTRHTFTFHFTHTQRQRRAALKLMYPGTYRFGGPPLIHNGKKPRSGKGKK